MNANSQSNSVEQLPSTDSQTLSAQVARLAGAINQSHYSNGDRAALKRWAPGQLIPLAYYRLWLHHLRTEPPPEDQTESWMAIIWGLALGGEGGHTPKHSVGQALAETRFSEARLERLLSAPDDVIRVDLFQAAVRFLVAKGQGCNWGQWARYLLTQDVDKRERMHRDIARDYYRQLRLTEPR